MHGFEAYPLKSFRFIEHLLTSTVLSGTHAPYALSMADGEHEGVSSRPVRMRILGMGE